MTKIIVTGANGYVGRHVVKELIKQNIDFLAVDISTDTLPDNINKMNCDIFNEKNLFDKFGKPDILLHLAWRDGFVHNSKKHFEDLSSHGRLRQPDRHSLGTAGDGAKHWMGGRPFY